MFHVRDITVKQMTLAKLESKTWGRRFESLSPPIRLEYHRAWSITYPLLDLGCFLSMHNVAEGKDTKCLSVEAGVV